MSLIIPKPNEVLVAQDPTTALSLATKQYVDARASKWTDDGSLYLSPAITTRNLNLPGNANAATVVLAGSFTTKGYLQAGNTASWTALGCNRNPISGTVDDASKPSWQLNLHVTNDNFVVWRQPATPPGGSAVTLMTLSNTGKLTIAADPTAALDVATKQYVDARTAVAAVYGASVTPSLSATTTASQFASVPNVVANGRTCLVYISALLSVNVSATGQTVLIVAKRGGATWYSYQATVGASAAIEVPLALGLQFYDQAVPGTVSYTWEMSGTATATVKTPSSGTGRAEVLVFN